MIEIITHDVGLLAAHMISAQPGSSTKGSEISLTSSSTSKGRYILELDDARSLLSSPTRKRKIKGHEKGKVGLSFHEPEYTSGDSKRVRKVEFSLGIGRRLRSSGWERLKIQVENGKWDRRGHNSASAFKAYRLIDQHQEQDQDRPNPGGLPKDRVYRQTILIFAQQDSANFLSRLPDDTPLGDLTLPGTHETCALYGYPISQCQQPSTPILQQLMDGVRFLDVRLRVVGDELLMYHGPRPQRSTLKILLSVLHDFLFAHPGETVILCIKQETPPWHPHFSSILYKAFQPFLDRWWLEERIPFLGEVRGKGILLSRFDRGKDTESNEKGGEWDCAWPGGMGIHPYRWPDSVKEGFEWHCAGTTVRTQDWYRVHTFLQIPEKLQAITSHLEPTTTRVPSNSLTNAVHTPLTLSYTSASYFPLSLPTIIAKGFGFPSWGLGVEGINTRFCRYLLGLIRDEKKIRATVAMDFYRQCGSSGGNDLAGLLVLMNFTGTGSGSGSGSDEDSGMKETLKKKRLSDG
ncbi:hypothetical protein IAT40_005546 [Kwoniella sp. CBS 6097]